MPNFLKTSLHATLTVVRVWVLVSSLLLLLLPLFGCSHSPLAPSTTLPAPAQTAPTVSDVVVPGSWTDNFNTGLSERWQSNDYTGIGPTQFRSDNVDFSFGMLREKLTQSFENGQLVSKGVEVQSKQVYGFGTYTFVMRTSSTSETPDGQGQMLLCQRLGNGNRLGV